MAGDARIGTVVAGCRIISVIGRGGMGVVYLAQHEALERRVALKLLSPELAQDPEFRERFQSEARIAASLDHPNVVPIHDAGESDGELYIVMRWVDGLDLRALLRENGGTLPVESAVALLTQVADALDAAHARGLVHRDVKPANVLVTASREHAYLSDFGLTKLVSASSSGLTRTGQWIGTIDYVAPEQIEGRRLDARTDVYALGCLLFQALTGSVPFPREHEIAKVWAHVNADPPSLSEHAPELPRALGTVLSRALAKDPDARYASAGGLARAVLAAVQDRELPADDRSVAIGAAAPVSADDVEPTSDDDAPPEEDGATAVLPQPHAPASAVDATLRKPLLPPSPAARKRSARTPVLLALVAVLLVVGGVTALALRGSPSDLAETVAATQPATRRPAVAATTPSRDDQRTTAAAARAPRKRTRTVTAAAPPAAPGPPAEYAFHSGLDYSVERPRGWSEVKTDVTESDDPPRYRSEWSSDECGCAVVIDWMPGYGLSAIQNAREAEGGEIRPASVGVFSDVALRTASSGDLHTATYYASYGSGNLAVRAETKSAATALAIADHVAGTLLIYGGD
ncbi:protein kinase [Conexibacter sp. JD483]|uniref:serine/threonine-protein kinase n=1 Tax=unclassified Conexibacter TaxID=2627773 RepID=UPI00271DBC1C|nr:MULTISPECIES: serine/threonine-protein kinase [unclassified Conexibacter]MDO8184979.1 protein kinase [Conexibacter sp. CPCC 205706]MDO8198123.1 protein kinase [Conexibacter sp. CPCC 205762]MDR9368255.1 protein kinase [Conexibacter sp. JD483]